MEKLTLEGLPDATVPYDIPDAEVQAFVERRKYVGACEGKWTRFIALKDILLMDRASFTEDAQTGDRLIAFENFSKSTFKYHF